MPYQDTLQHFDDLAGVDPYQFDEICLKNPRRDCLGEDVWHKVKLLKARARGEIIEPELKQRLIVYIDDEQDMETVKRVRVALGLPEDQLFSAWS